LKLITPLCIAQVSGGIDVFSQKPLHAHLLSEIDPLRRLGERDVESPRSECRRGDHADHPERGLSPAGLVRQVVAEPHPVEHDDKQRPAGESAQDLGIGIAIEDAQHFHRRHRNRKHDPA
jgi:hypothetical protein